LRELGRQFPNSAFLFATERGALYAGFDQPFPVHAHMLRHGCGYTLNKGHDHAGNTEGLARSSLDTAHCPLHRTDADPIQGLLARLKRAARNLPFCHTLSNSTAMARALNAPEDMAMARLAMLWPTLALAITLPVATAQAADPQGCTPQERSNHALTDHAARNGGVICPPDIDPAMKQATPNTGDTPTVPAPVAPGGDQSVQPK
jgi:hypothetical protein